MSNKVGDAIDEPIEEIDEEDVHSRTDYSITDYALRIIAYPYSINAQFVIRNRTILLSVYPISPRQPMGASLVLSLLKGKTKKTPRKWMSFFENIYPKKINESR